MGNVAVAEELAGNDELYKLDASETEPEDEDLEEGDEEDAEDEGGVAKPGVVPHG